MSSSGLSFLNHVVDSSFTIDFELVSGFLSAIEMFAKNISGSSLDGITFGNSSLTLLNVPLKPRTPNLPSSYFIIAAFVNKGENSKKALVDIETVRDAFFKIYSPEDVLTWDGNVLTFLPFAKYIPKVLSGDSSDLSDAPVERYAVDKTDEMACMAISTSSGDIVKIAGSEVVNDLLLKVIRNATNNILHSGNATWEGIIPVLDQHKIIYVQARKCDDKQILDKFCSNDPLLISGYYFLNERFQIYLGRIIPELAIKFNECFDALMHDAIKGNLETLETTIVTKCSVISPLATVMSQPVAFTTSFDLPDLKNADHLIHALITNQPVVVTGSDPNKIQGCVNNLLFFTPHRTMQIINEPTDDKDHGDDVILINPGKMKTFKDMVLVDVDKRQVKNGDANKYCEKIRKDIQGMKDPLLISSFIKQKVNWLVSKANLLRNLSWGGIVDTRDIMAIRADLEPDAEKIVLHFASGKNATIQNLLDFLVNHVPVNRLLLDLHFAKFGEKKVLVNANLTPAQIAEYKDRLMKIGNVLLGPKVMSAIKGV